MRITSLLLFLFTINLTIMAHKDATTKALLIIDIQNDYFENGAKTLVKAEEASLKAKEILEFFREKNMPIIHIQHLANREGATFFIPNTFGAEIHKNVQPLDNEKVIIKHFPNSFRDTELQDHLQQQGITELVICGMMTSMCVDATTRAAKDLGYDCTVISDACAAPDLEIQDEKIAAKDVHHAFLAGLAYFYAQVSTTEDYLLAQ